MSTETPEEQNKLGPSPEILENSENLENSGPPKNSESSENSNEPQTEDTSNTIVKTLGESPIPETNDTHSTDPEAINEGVKQPRHTLEPSPLDVTEEQTKVEEKQKELKQKELKPKLDSVIQLETNIKGTQKELLDEAISKQEYLLTLVNAISQSKLNYEKLSHENKYLQEYIGNLMSSSNLMNSKGGKR